MEENEKMSDKNINRYLNYLIIGYAFSFPISKAAINIFELLIFLVWIYQGNWREKYQFIRINKFIIYLTLFIAFTFTSIIWSSDKLFVLNYMGKYHHLLIIPIIYTSLEKKYISHIFSSFIVGLFISEIMSYGIYFNLFTYGHATHEFPTPFMQHITYSVVLAFAAALLLTNFFTENKKKYKLFNILFFSTITANLFINGGRTGQVIFIALIFIVSLMYIKHKIKAFLLSICIIMITFLFAYNFSYNFPSRINQFESGISKMINNNDYTGQGGVRASLWIVGSDVFLNNFFIGTGVSDVMKEANHYASLHTFKTTDMKRFSDYDNTFINVAAELGIIGLGLLICTFYSLFRLQLKTQQYRVLHIVFVVSFLLFSVTHATLHLMFPLVFFSLFSGLFIGISRIENQVKN